MKCILFFFFAILGTISISNGQTIAPFNSLWKYFKGTQEASSPVDYWKEMNFDDSSWNVSVAPFYYGETVSGGTLIPDMQNQYSTLFSVKTL